MAVLAPSLSQVRSAQVLQSLLAVVLDLLHGRDWLSPSLQWVAWKSSCLYQNQYFGSQTVKSPGWDIFFATLSQLFIFSLPASLFNMMLRASAVSLVRIALFLQGALLALLMLWMVVLLGKRRGRLESFQLEVVVPLPKKQNKKNMEINSSPLCTEGGETAP